MSAGLVGTLVRRCENYNFFRTIQGVELGVYAIFRISLSLFLKASILFLWKCDFIHMEVKLVSIWMVVHQASLWQRGLGQLGNGLLQIFIDLHSVVSNTCHMKSMKRHPGFPLTKGSCSKQGAVFLSFYLSVSLYVYLLVCLSVCLFVCLSVCACLKYV